MPETAIPRRSRPTTSTNTVGCDCSHCRAHALGLRGPFAPQEFYRLFGAVNEPTPVEYPADVVALGRAAEAVEHELERAHASWFDAIRKRDRVASPTYAGGIEAELDKGRRVADAEAAIGAAREVVEEVEERLVAARTAYRHACAAHVARIRGEEAATLAAVEAQQGAEAKAERERRVGVRDRLMGR